MLIGGLQNLTLIDYPGKVACAVFTVGCNFRCHFCHNPELVKYDMNDTNAARTTRISEPEFFEFLKSRQGLLDAVCVTGGEPTLHRDLPEFIKKIKALGFFVKLDTNGTNPEMLTALVKEKLIDYIAMDVKTNFKNYGEVTGAGVNAETIKESIKTIMESGLDYEFRTTVVPGLHTEDDLSEIAEFIRGAKRYYLQQFRPGEKILGEKYRTVKPYPPEFLAGIREKIKSFFEICEVRD